MMFDPATPPGHPIECANIANLLNDISAYAAYRNFDGVVDICGSPSRTVQAAVPTWICLPKFPMSGGKSDVLMGPVFNNKDDDLTGVKKNSVAISGYCHHGPVIGKIPNCGCSKGRRLIILVNVLQLLKDPEVLRLLYDNGCYDDDKGSVVVFINNIIPADGYALNVNGEGFQIRNQERSVGMFRGDMKIYDHAPPTKSMIQGHLEAGQYSVTYVPWFTKSNVVCQALIPDRRLIQESMPKLSDAFSSTWRSYASTNLVPNTTQETPTWGVIEENAFNMLMASVQLTLNDWNAWFSAISTVVNNNKYKFSMKPQSPFFWTRVVVQEKFRQLTVLKNSILLDITDFKVQQPTVWNAIKSLFSDELISLKSWEPTKIKETLTKALKISTYTATCVCVFIALCVPGAQLIILPVLIAGGFVVLSRVAGAVAQHFHQRLTEHCVETIVATNSSCLTPVVAAELPRELPTSFIGLAWLITQREIQAMNQNYDDCLVNLGVIYKGGMYCARCSIQHSACSCGQMNCPQHFCHSSKHPLRTHMDAQSMYITHMDSSYIATRAIVLANQKPGYSVRQQTITVINGQPVMPCYASTRNSEVCLEGCSYDVVAVDDNDDNYAQGGHGLKVPKIWNPVSRNINAGICLTHALIPARFRSYGPQRTCRLCAIVRKSDPYPDPKLILDRLSIHTYIGDVESGRCMQIVGDVIGIRALRPIFGVIGGVMQPLNCGCGLRDFYYCIPAPRAALFDVVLSQHIIGGWCRSQALDHAGALVNIRPGMVINVSGTKMIVTNNTRCMHSLASYGTASFNNYLGLCSRLEYVRMTNYIMGQGCPNCWLNPGCMHTFETRSFTARPWASNRGLAFSLTDGNPMTAYVGSWLSKLNEFLDPLRHEFNNTESYTPEYPHNVWLNSNLSILREVEMTTDDQEVWIHLPAGNQPVEAWRYGSDKEMWVDAVENGRALGLVSKYNKTNYEFDMPKMDKKELVKSHFTQAIECKVKAMREAKKVLKDKNLIDQTMIDTIEMAGGCTMSCFAGYKASVLRHLSEIYTYYEWIIGSRRPVKRNLGQLSRYERKGACRAEIRFQDLTKEEVQEFSDRAFELFAKRNGVGLFVIGLSDEELKTITGINKDDILWDDITQNMVSPAALGGEDGMDKDVAEEVYLPYRALKKYVKRKFSRKPEDFANPKHKYLAANYTDKYRGLFKRHGEEEDDLCSYINTHEYCPIHNKFGIMNTTNNIGLEVRQYRKQIVRPVHNELRVSCLEKLLNEKGLRVFANRAEDYPAVHQLAHNQGKTVRIYYEEEGWYKCRQLGASPDTEPNEFVEDDSMINIMLVAGDQLSFMHATYCTKFEIAEESDDEEESGSERSVETDNEDFDSDEEQEEELDDKEIEAKPTAKQPRDGDTQKEETGKKENKPGKNKNQASDDEEDFGLGLMFKETSAQTDKVKQAPKQTTQVKEVKHDEKTAPKPAMPKESTSAQNLQEPKREKSSNEEGHKSRPMVQKTPTNPTEEDDRVDPFGKEVGDIIDKPPRSISEMKRRENIIPFCSEKVSPLTFRQFWVIIDKESIYYCSNKTTNAPARFWNGCMAFVKQPDNRYVIRSLYLQEPTIQVVGDTQTVGTYNKRDGYDNTCGGANIKGGTCTWRYPRNEGEKGCLDPFCLNYNRAIQRSSMFRVIKPKAKQTFDPNMINEIVVDLEASRVKKCLQDNKLSADNPITRALKKLVDNEKLQKWPLKFFLVNGPWGSGKSFDYKDEKIIVPTRCLKMADTSSRSETPHLALNAVGEGEDLVIDECYTYDMILLCAYQMVTKKPLVLLGDFMQFSDPNSIPTRDMPSVKLKRIWKTHIYRSHTRLQHWLTYKFYTSNSDWKMHKPEEITWEHNMTDDVIIKEEDLATTYQTYNMSSVVYVVTPKINSSRTKHDCKSEQAEKIRQLVGSSDVKIISSLTTQGITTIVTNNPQTSVSIIFYIPKFKSSNDLINVHHLVPITRAGVQGQFCICIGEGYDMFKEFYNNMMVADNVVARDGVIGVAGIKEDKDPLLTIPKGAEPMPRDKEIPAKLKFSTLIKTFLPNIKNYTYYIDMTYHEGKLAHEINEQTEIKCLGRANELRGDKIYVIDDGKNVDCDSFLNKVKRISASNAARDTIIILDWPVKTNDGFGVEHSVTPRGAFVATHALLKMGYSVIFKWTHYRENYYRYSLTDEKVPLWYVNHLGQNVMSTPPNTDRAANWFTMDCKEIYYLFTEENQLALRNSTTLRFDRASHDLDWEMICRMPILFSKGTKIEEIEGDLITDGNQLKMGSIGGPNWTVNAIGTIHSHIGSVRPHEVSCEDKIVYQSKFYKSCFHFIITSIDAKRMIITCDVWWYSKGKASKLLKESGVEMAYAIDSKECKKHTPHTLNFSPPDGHKPSHALFRNLDLQEGLDLIKTSPMVRFQESRFVSAKPQVRIAAYNEGIPIEGYLGYAFDYTTANLAHAIYHRALGVQNTTSYHQLTTGRYMLNYLKNNREKFFPPAGSLICPPLAEVVKGLPSNRKNAIMKAPNEVIDGTESWSMFSKGDEININGYGGCPRAIVAPPPKLLRRDLPVSSAFTKWWSDNNKNDKLHYTGCLRSEEIGKIIHESGATTYEDGDVEKCDKSARSWECAFMMENIFKSIDPNSSEWCLQNNGWGSFLSASARRVRAKGIILTQFGVVPSGTAFTSLYNTIKAKWVNSAAVDITGPQEIIYVSDDFGVLDPKEMFVAVRDFLALGMNWTLDVKIVPIDEATYNSQCIIRAYRKDEGGALHETYILVPNIIRGLKRYFIKTNLDNKQQLKCLNYAEQYGIAHTPLLRGFWKHQCKKFGLVKELSDRWKAQHRFDVKPRVGDMIIDSEGGMDRFMSARYGLQPTTWRQAENDLESGKRTPMVQAVFQHILNWGPEPSTKSGDPTWLGHRLTDWTGMISTTDTRTKSQSYPAGVPIN